jgi:hypothetical protein
MNIDFDQLLAATATSKDDTTELKLAYSGRVAAMRAYQERPGKLTADDLTAAKKLYEQTFEQLAVKYFPRKVAKAAREFKSQKDARQYLLDLGYKVSSGKFSQDAKKFTTGKGDIHEAELLDYARGNLRKDSDYTDNGAEREKAETRKAIAAADREEMKRDDERRALDKQWIEREAADLQTCAWAAMTRDAIAGRLKKDIPALIYAAGGDPARIPDVSAIIDQAITDGCNDIAGSGDVDVEIEDVEQD